MVLEPEAISPGETTTLTAEFTNPLSVPLTNGTVVVSVDDGLSVNGGFQVTLPLSTVNPGGLIEISQEVMAVFEGHHTVLVNINTDQLGEITGEETVFVGLFADGFESGDETGWSNTVGE